MALLALFGGTQQLLDERQQDEDDQQQEFNRHESGLQIHGGGAYRRGGVGSFPPSSAIDSRIDESAWMFFIR